ncbi:MAG: OmpA family protein [Clostridia bacterium]|nr:OmpA family protein [Clostridia bacterium]
MKKIISIIMTLCLLSLFTSCSNDSKKTAEKTDSAISAPETYDVNSDASSGMNFQIDDQSFNFEIEPIKPVSPTNASFNFEIEEFDTNIFANIVQADLEKIDSLSEEDKKIILEKKEALLTDIADILIKNNINVMIDEISGEIVMDASILFDVDDAEVSDDGKAFLKAFIPAYSSVICNDKYSDFIAAVYIEGHTDTDGSYEYNKDLSQKRADNVKSFCLSDGVITDKATLSKFKSLTSAHGCSYDNPIKDSNGNVDKSASRRVTFRFLINI